MPVDEQQLRGRLRATFEPGTRLADQATLVEVRDAPGEVVLLVRFDRDETLYGVPIGLGDTGHEYYYGDPVTSVEEWVDSVALGVRVQLDTGLRRAARRRRVEDHVELRSDGGWPQDLRFHLDTVTPGELRTRVPGLASLGLDTAPALAAREAGRFQAWHLTYENNSAGEPYVAHLVAVRADADTVHLDDLWTLEGLPRFVVVDLVRDAAHHAGERGAGRVTTTLPLPELELIGFVPDPDGPPGTWVVTTDFLHEAPSGAMTLLLDGYDDDDRWGDDRDAAGRYLPRSRFGRAWHRLRHGASGRAVRSYAVRA